MKSAKTILGSLVEKHTFYSLSPHSCYKQFLDLLPPRFRQAIAFVTIRRGHLMVALSHPGYKMELYYNKELLKSLLSSLARHEKSCAFMREVDDIVFFISKYHNPSSSATENNTVPHYSEQAEGNFSEELRNMELGDIFRNIKRLIISRNSHND